MKKLSVLLVAAIVVLALAMPAAAFENEFGGYWRTRFITDIGFTGEDQLTSKDGSFVDTRTRLFYTAKFSDNLKFVNKFEMNAGWGTPNTYGQVAADGANFVIKNSYVDFKLGQQRFTVGAQDFLLMRGYLFGDDAAGIKAIFKVNDAVYLPLIYVKGFEGGVGRLNNQVGNVSNSDFDGDLYVFYPTIYLNKDNSLKPHVSYTVSQNASKAVGKGGNPLVSLPGLTEVELWTAGLEYDGKFDIFSFGATAMYQWGDLTVPAAQYGGHDSLDVDAYLFDIFGGVDLGPSNIHGKFIYASGNDADDPFKSGEVNGVITLGPNPGSIGASYYWAEIMGFGLIDNAAPTGAPGDKISNLFIANLGASYKVLPTLKFSLDAWYAQHAEDVYLKTTKQYSDELGWELDFVTTYTIVDNLKVDLIAAYLWAGDAIQKSTSATGDENPYELAAMLSLAF